MKKFILALPLIVSLQALANPVPGQPIEGCERTIDGYACAFDAGACTYRPSLSVLFLDHCGRRNGVIIFKARANAEICPDMREYYNGLFLSAEDWEKNTPCTE